MLSEARAVPQLTRHDDFDWHIHAIDQQAPLDTRILVESAMAMVDVIRADEMSRLAICADDTCEGVVLDLSRNRSRRFCSTTCGNRNAVAAYRARQQASPAEPRNRFSTSTKTCGCSLCTQWPAPLTVTRRLRGNQRSIAST